MGKLRNFLKFTLAIAKHEGMNVLVVATKIFVARFRFGLGIRYFGMYGLANKKIATYAD